MTSVVTRRSLSTNVLPTVLLVPTAEGTNVGNYLSHSEGLREVLSLLGGKGLRGLFGRELKETGLYTVYGY